eukprot:GFUD01025759.1.p1 GENE.GFUD01025759.1~~GFUD01025759.1.p1  ORF type:complete len:262 (+),score=78.68 GFUD01025759.1:171-956(+)
MFLHGAANIFFQTKLAEAENNFNAKFKKFEQMFGDELLKMSRHQSHEFKQIKNEVKLLREEVSYIKKSEEDLSVKGMDKISKLNKDVKSEVKEMKTIKSEINQMKKELSVIRESEEDLSTIGMVHIFKLGEEFNCEVKQLKSEISALQTDIVIIKETKQNKTEPVIDLKHELYREFQEGIHHSDNHDKKQKPHIKPLAIHENLLNYEYMTKGDSTDDHRMGQDQDMTFNDDHVRSLVFTSSSQESSDYLESEDDNEKHRHS